MINTAAYTAVDVAETNSSYAYAVNTAGAAHVAAGADDVGARLVHVSTDYVFNGVSGTHTRLTLRPHPCPVYGQTKRDGEEAVLDATNETALIVRTAWLYASYGRNFALTMLTLYEQGKACACRRRSNFYTNLGHPTRGSLVECRVVSNRPWHSSLDGCGSCKLV